MKPYLDIMEHFGYRAQMKKLAEECYEFLEAVDNYEDLLLLSGATEHEKELARDFVIEEMGDMLVLLTQFLAKYNIEKNELDKHMDEKIARTLRRIEAQYYEHTDE